MERLFTYQKKIKGDETCETCGELKYKKAEDSDLWIPRNCTCRIAFMQKYEEREKKIKLQQRQDEINRVLQFSKMGKVYQDKTLTNFEKDRNLKAHEVAKNYILNFKKHWQEGSGLLFNGTSGTGKTHLTAAIANNLLAKGRTVIFGTWSVMLEELRLNIKEKKDYYGVLNAYNSCDLLVLDDLGQEKSSEWTKEMLFNVINSRYLDKLPVIITTNLDMKLLEAHVGTAVFSRLMEMTREVPMLGKDYRKMRRSNGNGS